LDCVLQDLPQYNKRNIKSFTINFEKLIVDSFDQIILSKKITILQNNQNKDNESTNDSNPTQEEIEAFTIVKSILRDTIPLDRIKWRNFKGYWSILLDDNQRYSIVKLYFENPSKKQLLFYKDKNTVKTNFFSIDSVDDIYTYADKIKEIAKKYDNDKGDSSKDDSADEPPAPSNP
jgi:hypothetical protein